MSEQRRRELEAGRVAVLLGEVAAVMGQQDKKYGSFHSDPYDVRAAIAFAEDELRETLDAWREERSGILQPPESWAHTREEALQTAAVLLRLAREL